MAVTFENIKPTLLTALRITDSAGNSALVTELQALFNACLVDLNGAGVDLSKNEDLLKQSVIFYCKANFGLQADEKWQMMYERTRDALGSRTSEIEEAAT